MYKIGASLGTTNFKGLYDLQLEHFGISRRADETDLEYLIRVLNSEEFMSHNDNAIYDLTIDYALALNDGIEILDDVYYFSVCGDATHYSTVTQTEVPDSSMFVLLKPFGTMMGKYYDETTAGGVYIDKTWLPNDGMVNVVSGLYPINSELKCVKPDGSQGYVICDGYNDQEFQKGIWNVLPTQPYDHLSIVGGIMSNTVSNVRHLFIDLLENIVGTYGSEDADNPIDNGLPFTDVPKDRWSYDYILRMYQLGVINGRTETVFDPTGNVTRAEFVKMLAGLDGVDVSEYESCRFDDVNASSVFAPYIEWAAENGIVLGYTQDEFRPNENIKREQMAAMLCRYVDYAGITLSDDVPELSFTDGSAISAFAVDYVKTLQKAGVISGYNNGDGTYSFRPASFTTREQVCKVLCLI